MNTNYCLIRNFKLTMEGTMEYKRLTVLPIILVFLAMHYFGECATIGQETKDLEPTAISAAYFRQHKHLIPYEATAKVFFKVALPTINATDPGNCAANDVLCQTRKTAWNIKMKFDSYVGVNTGKTSRKKRDIPSPMNHTLRKSRPRRQVSLVVAGAAGFLLNTIFSKFTKKIFGSDDEAAASINQFRSTLIRRSQEHLYYNEAINKFAQGFEELEGRYWLFDSKVDQRVRALLFLNQVESTTSNIKLGIERCSNRRLPMEFVPEEDLKKMLMQVQSNVTTEGFQLSIPVSNLVEYYKTNIVDCMISSKYAYILLNVPLQKREWKVFDVIPVGFSYHNETCKVQESEDLIAVSRDRVEVIDTRMSLYCDTVRDHLCFIPSFSRSTQTCAQKMYNGVHLDKLSESCEVKCNTDSSVFVTDVDFNKVVVTNGKTLDVNCKSRSVSYNLPQIGATEIGVKCECTYSIDNEVVELDPLCDYGSFSDSDVKNVVPSFWLATWNYSAPRELNKSKTDKWSHMLPKNISSDVPSSLFVPRDDGIFCS